MIHHLTLSKTKVDFAESNRTLPGTVLIENEIEKSGEKLRLEMGRARVMWRALWTLRSGILGEYDRRAARFI